MTHDGFVLLSNAIALAATICFFSFIAFTVGFNKGVASVVTEDEEEEEQEETVKYVYIKPKETGFNNLKNKLQNITASGTNQFSKLENITVDDITDADDEETRIQKLRNKIEQEKTNKFFD